MKGYVNNKKKKIITLSILVIVIALIGLGSTFAIKNYYDSKVDISTLDMAINYSEIIFNSSELVPMSDNKVDITTIDNVIRGEFNVKGNENYDVSNVIYDIALKNVNIDCELLSIYTKWNLYKNNELISTGSFSPSFDSSIIKKELLLTNKQQKLLDYKTSGDNYVFIIWISDPCESLENCTNYVNQNDMLNKNITGKIVVNLYTTKKDIDTYRFRTIINDYKCS